ncbi:DUF5324 family protein [Streptomyces sp. NPDC052051]|uniref:DUF5324 family protein n=1 Tax=Streptomyces sp. NPDC052051 TaxID=3154649 RepID=UPI00341340F2
MTRIDSVRAATGSARDSVLHAAEVVAPYADMARTKAAQYAREAGVRLAPKMSQAADQARVQYGTYLAPRLVQARSHVPPRVDQAAQNAARAYRQAAEYSRPMIEQAMAVAGPAREEAAARSTAALAALRGQVTPKQIQKLVRRQQRRATAARAVKGLALLGVLAGSACAAWKWWDKQTNPDWLVEPPAATEVPQGDRLASVDGSGANPLDPDVQTMRADDEGEDGGRRGRL